MADHLTVSRTAEFDVSADELWSLVADGGRWTDWLVERADVEVAAGAEGTVVDDGVLRHVRVLTADHAHRRTRFEWDTDGETSTVDIEVVELDDGTSRLRVVETFATIEHTQAEPLAWDVRLLAMCSCVAVCCRT